MDEIRRIIREVDPPRPSMRVKTLDGAELTTAAKRRHTEPAKLPGALRGDLDWIVMKCLEKDRKRRYDTANGLALDLQRHLANEVVIARPPTTALPAQQAHPAQQARLRRGRGDRGVADHRHRGERVAGGAGGRAHGRSERSDRRARRTARDRPGLCRAGARRSRRRSSSTRRSRSSTTP